MAYGIEIKNHTNGKLIISESYSGFHYKGDATHQGSNMWRITGLTAGKKILPYVVPGSSQYTAVNAIVESSSGQYDVYLIGNTATRVLIFDTLETQASVSPFVGVRVVRAPADGSTVAFDTTLKPLCIAAVHDLSGYSVSNDLTSASHTIPSLNTPAIFCGSEGVKRIYINGPLDDYIYEYIVGARVSGTSLIYAPIVVGSWIEYSHSYIEENESLPEDILEDFVANGVVSVIDANNY